MKKRTLLFSVALLISFVLLIQTITSCSTKENAENTETIIPVQKVEAVVVSPNSFIIKDGVYSADILVGVKKASVEPTIYLTYQSPFYEEYEEEGETKYKLLEDADYETISVVDKGKGTYTKDCLATGVFSYGGLVHYEMDECDIWLPFKSEYTVGYAGFSVNGPDAHVLYKGEDNLIDVAVSGYPREMLNVKISQGSILPAENGKYLVRINGDVDKVEVSILINTSNGQKEIGKQEFEIRER